MRTTPNGATMARMELDVAVVTVTLEPASEPLAGTIGLPDGSTASFSGYVQLIAALERARERPPGDPGVSR